MSLLNIRSWADLRAFLYVAWPVVSAALLAYGVFDSDREAALWGALVAAVLGPVIAAFYARNLSAVRVAFYAVLAAVQAILIGYNISVDQVAHWVPLVSALIGLLTGGVATANTNTTVDQYKAAV